MFRYIGIKARCVFMSVSPSAALLQTKHFNRITVLPVGKLATQSDNKNSEILVYDGSIKQRIKMIKRLTLCSSAVGIYFQFFAFKKFTAGEMDELMVTMAGVFTIFTYVSPLIIHAITRKYVIHMHYNPETEYYTAILLNILVIPRVVKFKTDEVEIPRISRLFTTVYVTKKKIPLFLDALSFLDINHYKKIMGYDKPVNLYLFDDEDEVKQKEEKENTKPKKD